MYFSKDIERLSLGKFSDWILQLPCEQGYVFLFWRLVEYNILNFLNGPQTVTTKKDTVQVKNKDEGPSTSLLVKPVLNMKRYAAIDFSGVFGLMLEMWCRKIFF